MEPSSELEDCIERLGHALDVIRR
ncbi:hypothetical protein CCHR01_19890, partial [Colletotrichum chrysophilum]